MKKFAINNKLNLVCIILVVVLSIPIIYPYFQKGYFPTHDGEWAVVRLSDMYRLLRDFQIPPRYSGNLNFGYGYPLFNFAYPFPYYLGMIFKMIGFGFVNSIKILFALSVPVSGLAMFFLSTRIWSSKTAGLLSALLYIYLPYRFVDLYVRGSIGESLAFIFFPLIVLSLYQIYTKRFVRLFMISLAFNLAFLVMTHNIMTVLFLPVLGICIGVFFLLNKKAFILSLVSIFLGLGLSMFFWFPALIEKQFIALSMTPIAERSLYFVNPSQLIIPGWGYGTPTDLDSFSYQLGISQILACCIVLIISLIKIKKNKDKLSQLALMIILFILIYSLMLYEGSSFLWKILPLFSEINYPWTLLAIFGFLMSLVAGYVGKFLNLKIIAILLVAISITTTLSYAKPINYVNRGEGFYFTNDATTTSFQELMPLWVKNKPVQRFDKKVEILSNRGEILNLQFNSKKISFSPQLETDEKLRINSIYYPGWRAYSEGKELPISINNNLGVMEINVPKEAGKIEIIFSETPLRLLADICSILSFTLLCIFIFMPRRKLHHSLKVN